MLCTGPHTDRMQYRFTALQVKVGSFSYELAMTGVSFKLLQDMVAAGAMSKQEFHKVIHT